MAGYGFHRDIGNSELDIQVAGTVVATFAATSLTLPVGTISLIGRTTALQETDHGTAVTGANGTSGTITLASVNLGAAAEAEFTVANTSVAANDIVILSTGAYNDGAGTPIATVSTVAANTFSITLSNPGAADGWNDASTINFAVIKSVA